MASSVSRVKVAVGVIRQLQQDNSTFHYFVCRRRANQHQGNKWEFPGGKVDGNESIQQALSRELQEEIGIGVISSKPLTLITFDYPDKKVELHVRLVTEYSGTAHGAEGQESKWVTFSDLVQLEFPEANQQIITALRNTNEN